MVVGIGIVGNRHRGRSRRWAGSERYYLDVKGIEIQAARAVTGNRGREENSCREKPDALQVVKWWWAQKKFQVNQRSSARVIDYPWK